jgi:choline dehydrogenase-like flavoprotein
MITSPDPAAPLHIDPCFFTTAADRTVAAGIFHRMREFFASEPIASRLAGETFPGADVQSDEDIINAALDGGYCGYHAAGTCAMGPNGGDVVDSQLRLRGLQNLRVVDCSVMPTMIAGNLNGPIMAMASRASDLILGQA